VYSYLKNQVTIVETLSISIVSLLLFLRTGMQPCKFPYFGEVGQNLLYGSYFIITHLIYFWTFSNILFSVDIGTRAHGPPIFQRFQIRINLSIAL